MKMKMPIAWHEDCLRNMKRSLEMKDLAISKLTEERDRLRGDIMILSHQIQAAEYEGRDGFDRERFLQKRKMK
jgi:hypothetical protein